MSDLIIDSQIRTWVFLPIVIITFLVGLLKHYLTILCRGAYEVDLDLVRDTQTLIRVQNLRENGHFVTAPAFRMRKQAFLAQKTRLLAAGAKQNSAVSQLLDNRGAVKDNMLLHLINYLPTVMIGSWLMYMLSGFLIAKIPVPLTLCFKSMFQRDIYLRDLEAQWVSSASWFFLNVGGMRSLYDMVLDPMAADEEAGHYAATATMAPQDRSALFKNEIDYLHFYEHAFCLQDNDV